MIKQHRNLLNWRSVLSTLAISVGIFSLTESPARAIPNDSQSSVKLAQVGVRSRINGPTPLNLRPRTHIPLPRSRNGRYGSYYRYPEYREHHYDGYRYNHDHHHTHRRRKRRRGRGPVIIISPSNYSEYTNYDGYIRVIRK